MAALFVLHGYSLGPSPQDDAFISFRYAKNLLDGNGLVFNPGERVEGYTNFLWTVSMAPVIATGIDPVEGCRAIGSALAVGLILLLWWSQARPVVPGGTGTGGWVGVGAGLILASSSSIVAEAVQGLETVLFALLVTAMILVVEREEERGGGGWLPGLLGGLAALTRPEGTLVLLGTAAHRLLPPPWSARPAGGPERSFASRLVPALRSVAVCFAIAVPHRLAAWAYYGQPVPNTFYAKVGGTADAVLRGASYAGEFAFAWLPVIALALIGLVPLSRARRSLRGAFILGYIAYIIGVGGDYKWTLRFFAPVMPLLALLAAGGIGYLARLIESLPVRRALACALCLGASLSTWWLSAPSRDFARIRVYRYETDRLAGQWLERNVPPGSLLATSNAGIIPYYAGLPTIDMLGLTDEHISHVEVPWMGRGVAGHEKADGEYVLSRRPEIVLFMQTRTSPDGPVPLEEAVARINFMAELQLWQNPVFRRDYEWVSAPISGYTLNFFRLRPEGKPAAGAAGEGT